MPVRVASSQSHPDQGFTLIEVMVTVAIIGVLAAVALPSYKAYVVRGKIPEATAGLATRQVRLEQFFQDRRSYTGSPECSSDTTSSKYFNFSCSSSSASAFILQAVGKDTMAGFTYTVNEAGLKTTAALPSGWTTPNPNTCWATKQDGSC